MDFTRNLKQARHKIGISQKELAGRIGVAQGTIGNWETGTREPKLSQLEDIARALKTTLAELIK